MMTEAVRIEQALPTQASRFDGHSIERLCKETLAGAGDQALVDRIQSAYPEYAVCLGRLGHEWYRLGGVIKPDGSRIAPDLNEWAERTFIECGQNFNTLLDYCEENSLLATQHKGITLYLVAQTGPTAEDFVQIEIDRTQEVAERYLIDPDVPPDDLEELIDPLKPLPVEPFAVGAARYTYRRKTEVTLFMEELARHRSDRHPAQRFMDDWNHSSARHKAVFCRHWSLRLSQHQGRHGERIMNVDVVSHRRRDVPRLEGGAGKKGKALAALLHRFDSQAGYPFAWFFFVTKGLVPIYVAEAVHRDLSKDYAYLPDRDAAVLRCWMAEPYLL